jgi:SAM-dependent methyltransferase
VHHQVAEFFSAHAPSSGRSAGAPHVLEVGSLDINGSVREWFTHASSYHGIDLAEGPGVDEVADAADWTPPRSYDVVACAEVLEHAPRWSDILAMCWSALRPGGTLLMTCATTGRAPHSAVDGLDVRPGEYYRNVPPGEVRAVVAAWNPWWSSIEVAAGRGDLYLRVDAHRS